LTHIDLGNMGKRVLVAGLKNHYSSDELMGKKIVVVTNLEPATIRGVTSNGMLLAATDQDGVVSLLDPQDAQPGDHVTVEKIAPNPLEQLPFADFQEIKMTINENGEAMYGSEILKTSSSVVKTDKPVKKGAKIQ
jgi:tRNA-binding EMAP/Myf-like protein